MQKIIIIGICGAGKSTLAKKLGKKLDVEVHHLDKLFFEPNWVIRNKTDFDADLKKIMLGKSWILDGNYNRTMAMRIAEADTILFLDFSTPVALWRVLKRRLQYRNQVREDVAEGCKENINIKFLAYVATFRKKKRPALLENLKKVPKHKKVFIFKNDKEVEVFLK